MEVVDSRNILQMTPKEVIAWVEQNVRINDFSFEAAFAGMLACNE